MAKGIRWHTRLMEVMVEISRNTWIPTNNSPIPYINIRDQSLTNTCPITHTNPSWMLHSHSLIALNAYLYNTFSVTIYKDQIADKVVNSLCSLLDAISFHKGYPHNRVR